MTEERSDSVEERLEALEADVNALESKLTPLVARDVPLLTGGVRALVDGEAESLEELPAAARQTAENRREARAQLEAVRSRVAALGDLGAERTSKEEKIAAVLTFAFNKGAGESKVSVTPQEIRGCTGVSRRYAYDLVEDIGSSVTGCRVREAEVVQTSTGSKRKPKALLVDCEAVHAESEAVSRLNTGGDE
ncbi:hypothetical protein [Salinigranum halophilum]|uniref:hypothetical protein n=1 Tax=Salinigranum halophilum TaxID=2565931 RepID=UPI0013763A88|nr:hypothetical protein [Salinigranum halophilum]